MTQPGCWSPRLKAVGTDSRAKVREGLIGLKGYEGATGPISYAEGRDPAKLLVRITIKDGHWVMYKTVSRLCLRWGCRIVVI